MRKLSNVERAEHLLRESDLNGFVQPIDKLPEASIEYLGSTYLVTEHDPSTRLACTYKCVESDGEYKWERINYREDDALPPPTKLWANSVRDETTGRATVYIHWRDPEDTPTAHWKYTAVVKKKGSKPTGLFDGELVGYSSIRNQYAGKSGMIDSIDSNVVDASDIIDNDDGTTKPLSPSDAYYYNVFAVTVFDVVSFNVDLACGPNLTWEKFSELVKEGIASHALDIGDIVEIDHDDFGKINFQVVAFDNAKLKDETLKHSVTFMACDVLFRGSFDHKEPLLSPTTDTEWVPGKVYYNSATNQVIPDSSKRISIEEYNSAGQGVASEANPCADAELYGCNAWDTSNARQWLNSEKDENWFTPATPFDQYSSDYMYDGSYARKLPSGEIKHFGGFLKGIPSDLKNVLATSIIRTSVPSWRARSGIDLDYYETEDLIFLPSYVELFGVDMAFPSGVSKDEGIIFDIYRLMKTNTRMKYMLDGFDTTGYGSEAGADGKAKDFADCLASWYMRTPVRMVDVEIGRQPIECIEIVTAKNRRYDVQHDLGEDGGAGRQCYEPAGDKTSTFDTARDSRSNFFTPVGSTTVYCNNTAAGFVPCFVVA